MVTFYETKNFIVESRDHPHVCRTDGGHLCIKPKKPVTHRWDLDIKRADELMKISMIVGEAMLVGLNNRGIPVERINFQDNGNWAIGTEKSPKFHLHLYGRAKNSVNQKHGEALYFPDKKTKFFEKLEPLNKEDLEEIVKQIEIISRKSKYK